MLNKEPLIMLPLPLKYNFSEYVMADDSITKVLMYTLHL